MAELEEILTGQKRAFDRLFDQRILFMKGPLEDENGDLLVAQLLALDAESDEDVTLYVNSPGGSPVQSPSWSVRPRSTGICNVSK